MNLIIIILNRVYCALKIVNNQSPLFGSVILVTLLIGVNITNVIDLIYAFKTEPSIIGLYGPLLFIIPVFIILYKFANRQMEKITNVKLHTETWKNIVVGLLFLLTLILFIILSNINRAKILH